MGEYRCKFQLNKRRVKINKYTLTTLKTKQNIKSRNHRKKYLMTFKNNMKNTNA